MSDQRIGFQKMRALAALRVAQAAYMAAMHEVSRLYDDAGKDSVLHIDMSQQFEKLEKEIKGV